MSRLPTGTRRVHLVDIENLVGAGTPTRRALTHAWFRYHALGLVGVNDHLILACNPAIAVDVRATWPAGRLMVGRGPSGADRCLLRVLEHERLPDRFREVILGSGDGIFTTAVADLHRAGGRVVVVSRPCSMSAQLRLAATRYLPLLLSPVPPVADSLRAVAA